jgi:hypothetical protein
LLRKLKEVSMQKTGERPTRVLARTLAVEELAKTVGDGPGTVWTDGVPRKDLTQVSAGDVAGTPPPV